MYEFMQLLADTSRLAKAFESVPLTEKQKADIHFLYLNKDGVPVSRDKGRRVRGETVYSCSKIGSGLTKYFDGVGPQDKMMWIGFLSSDGENEKWVMRSEVRLAIRSLKWF